MRSCRILSSRGATSAGPLRLPIQQQLERMGDWSGAVARRHDQPLTTSCWTCGCPLDVVRAVRILLGFQAAAEIRARGCLAHRGHRQCIQGWVVPWAATCFAWRHSFPICGGVVGFNAVRKWERRRRDQFQSEVIPRAFKASYAASLIGLAALCSPSRRWSSLRRRRWHTRWRCWLRVVGHRGLVTVFSYSGRRPGCVGLMQHRPAHGRLRPVRRARRAVPYLATFGHVGDS